MENNPEKIEDKENLLEIVKSLKKENKQAKKKLEKLEEKYVQLNRDSKSAISDKETLVGFLKTVIPENMHSSLNKSSLSPSDLNRLWVIVDSQKESEFHKVLAKNKGEIQELHSKMQVYKQNLLEVEAKNRDLAAKIKDFACLELEKEQNKKTISGLEEEKHSLLCVIEEKDMEIERLSDLELEIAEIKAKSLMSNKRIEKTEEKPKIKLNTVCL